MGQVRERAVERHGASQAGSCPGSDDRLSIRSLRPNGEARPGWT